MNAANMLDRLLDNLNRVGLTVTAGERPGELLLHGPNEAKTPAVMEALKAFKPQLLERFARREEPQPATEPTPEPDPEEESCRVCGLTLDPEIIPRLADPLWCSIGGSPKWVHPLTGEKHPAQHRCPYKPPLPRGTN